jgi:hypothetical protein
VSVDCIRDQVAELLGKAGFDVRLKVVREPEAGVEKTPQGYLLAYKPVNAG